MNAGLVALLVLLSYLSGAIPMGVLVARLTGGTDPRTVGSGRTGGTNALRALGRRRALVVVIGDVGKGALPVLVARLLGEDAWVEVLCGAAAVIGSSNSVFVGFRGGRGVGTGVGTLFVIEPATLLFVLPVFVIVIVITRLVSLGSLLGSAAILPAMVILWLISPSAVPQAYLVFGLIGPALVWFAHRDNIRRLLRGEEHRTDLSMLSGRRSRA